MLNAWIKRNEHKSITLTRGDESLDLHGLSRREREEFVDRSLRDAHKEQLERNEKWKQLNQGGDESSP